MRLDEARDALTDYDLFAANCTWGWAILAKADDEYQVWKHLHNRERAEVVGTGRSYAAALRVYDRLVEALMAE